MLTGVGGEVSAKEEAAKGVTVTGGAGTIGHDV